VDRYDYAYRLLLKAAREHGIEAARVVADMLTSDVCDMAYVMAFVDIERAREKHRAVRPYMIVRSACKHRLSKVIPK
jgi:hypothetical protein